MTRIFALISVATVLLIGSAAVGASIESSSSTSNIQADIAAFLGTGFEVSALIPLLLIVGLFITVLGAVAR